MRLIHPAVDPLFAVSGPMFQGWVVGRLGPGRSHRATLQQVSMLRVEIMFNLIHCLRTSLALALL